MNYLFKKFIYLINKLSSDERYNFLYSFLVLILYSFRKIFKKAQYRRRFPIHYLKHKNIIGEPIFSFNDYSIYTQYYLHGNIDTPSKVNAMLSVKTELLYCEIAKLKEFKKFDTDVLVPIGIVNPNKKSLIKVKCPDRVNFNCNGKEYQLSQLRDNAFHYLRFNKGERVSFSSKKKILFGKPFKLSKKDKELVLVLFIDALGSNIVNSSNIENLMPNTYNFFKKGYINLNCYSNSEYTITSLSSMSTGKHVYRNNFFQPNKYKKIGEENKLISEYFHENGYRTQLISNNSGQDPNYGYCIGYDRTVYGIEMKQEEIVTEFIDSLRVFESGKSFNWLSFIDVHHKYQGMPRFSSGANMCAKQHAKNRAIIQKSVAMDKSKYYTSWYENEIKRFDFHMKPLYDFIEENFNNNEILVSLVSDHAQSFLDGGTHVLRKEKTNVPFMIRGRGVEKQYDNSIMENVDILPTILDKCNIDFNSDEIDGIMPAFLGGQGKKYVFSESIFPGKTYKAVIREGDKECFITSKSYLKFNKNIDTEFRRNVDFKIPNKQTKFEKDRDIHRYKNVYNELFFKQE